MYFQTLSLLFTVDNNGVHYQEELVVVCSDGIEVLLCSVEPSLQGYNEYLISHLGFSVVPCYVSRCLKWKDNFGVKG